MASTEDDTHADHDGDWFLRAVEERANADRVLQSGFRWARPLATMLLLIALAVIVFALITGGDRESGVAGAEVSAPATVVALTSTPRGT